MEKEMEAILSKAKDLPCSEITAIKLAKDEMIVLTSEGIILYPKGKSPTLPAMPPAAAPPAPAPPAPPIPPAGPTELEAIKKEMETLKANMKAKDEEIAKLKVAAPPKSAQLSYKDAKEKIGKMDGAQALKMWNDQQE